MLIVAGLFVIAAAFDVVRGAHALFPGFYAAFGLIGCTLIVVVSKWIGHSLLQRPEDAGVRGRDA